MLSGSLDALIAEEEAQTTDKKGTIEDKNNYNKMQEDFILREINRIGELIASLLDKVGLLKKSETPGQIQQCVKTELAEKLDLDIDTLLAGPDFIGALVGNYGFSNDNLEKFAELLFDFVAASEDRDEQLRLAASIGAIYSYLDEKKHSASLNRYYILTDLDKYIKEA